MREEGQEDVQKMALERLRIGASEVLDTGDTDCESILVQIKKCYLFRFVMVDCNWLSLFKSRQFRNRKVMETKPLRLSNKLLKMVDYQF